MGSNLRQIGATMQSQYGWECSSHDANQAYSSKIAKGYDMLANGIFGFNTLILTRYLTGESNVASTTDTVERSQVTTGVTCATIGTRIGLTWICKFTKYHTHIR